MTSEQFDSRAAPLRPRGNWVSGVVIAAIAALLAWSIHVLFPVIPLLTAAVALGIIAAQIPRARYEITKSLAPGLSVASKKVMRMGRGHCACHLRRHLLVRKTRPAAQP